MEASTASFNGIGSPWMWIGFLAFVLAMLALDLGVFHRKAEEVTVKHALAWTGVWVALSLVFDAGLYFFFGAERALEFLTGYLVEKSLSVDNIFVFILIFSTLAIPPAYQHRVLFWGILSALVLRAGMIVGGAALLARFNWLVYVFGAFLILTGTKMFRDRDEPESVSESRLLRVVRRVVPATANYDGERFFTRENGRRVATPLFVALVLIEATDVVFAVDSIPAILAISRDTFIVFTSNIFAILGLRSLYFVLAGAAAKLHYLKVGLAVVLVFVGFKMLAASYLHIPAYASLAIIAVILGVAVFASLRRARRDEAGPPPPSWRKPAPDAAE
ncbi:Integral membrane protein TerC [Minicystis rosea]|nr:Integral membrane protein TerC [Minicystis rosea]